MYVFSNAARSFPGADLRRVHNPIFEDEFQGWEEKTRFFPGDRF
jgi:hypothetical protein